MRTKSILIVLTAVLLMSANISRATLLGYVGTGAGHIYYMDFETGQYSEAYHGSLGDISSLEYDGDFFYAAGIHRFYKIDAATGDEVFMESVGNNITSLALAPDGTLYGIQSVNDKLIILDKENGNITDVGSIYGVEALAIDRNGRALARSDIAGFIEITLSDASFTPLGNLPSYDALDFGPDGNLYGWSHSDFFLIDIDAVTSTYIGHYPRSGEGFAMVPEPTTLLLLGLGAVMGRRRRKNMK